MSLFSVITFLLTFETFFSWHYTLCVCILLVFLELFVMLPPRKKKKKDFEAQWLWLPCLPAKQGKKKKKHINLLSI